MKAYGKRLGKIVILAAVLNFLIEFISRKSFAVLLAYVLESPLVFLLNTCIIALPFTVLFVSGNHENFDLLKVLPTEEWHGGKVQFIRPHVIHLLRGQVFEIEGYTFFTMGGGGGSELPE